MTSSAMRTHTAELKIIKARINPEPYFFATNGRRLSGEPPRASVSGSVSGAKEARCLDGACESTISFYMVYGSAIKKNYLTQDEILCLRLTPELAGQDGSKG